ncbi:MAG: hypothetical protein HYV09_39135 [Deltaproteobacteria bacterium]|nr:hypothetical protein [Deltaproteobacteria bacterium]
MGRRIGWRRIGWRRIGPEDLAALGDGALGGAVGTAAFTGWLFGAQKAGLVGELPPRNVTRSALERGVGEPLPERTVDVAASIAHLGFGVGVGALFGAIAHGLHARVPNVVLGAGFGALVWVASYAGWVPALDLMPRPDEDRRDRQWVNFVGHLLFGGILGVMTGAMTGRRR